MNDENWFARLRRRILGRLTNPRVLVDARHTPNPELSVMKEDIDVLKRQTEDNRTGLRSLEERLNILMGDDDESSDST